MSPSFCGSRPILRHWLTTQRRGLTLLELIVALGILAVLSTIAVRTLDPLADQTRYEATQRALNQLHDATFGDPAAKQLGGQRVLSGYLADTGLLPSSLADLSTRPMSIVAHGPQSFDSNRDTVNDVTLTSGWNGPYIQLGAGQTSVLDGWGRPPLVDPDGGDFNFISLGSDNDSLPPEAGYSADLSVTVAASQYTADVVFRLFAIDGTTGTRIDPAPTGTERLGVLIYGVNFNGGSSGAIEELMLPVAATGTFEVSRSNVVQGVAAARGVLWSDTNGDDLLDSSETVLKSSYVHYFTVLGGTDGRIEMELR